MSVERVEVVDLSAGADLAPGSDRATFPPSRPAPPLLVAALSLIFVAGVVGALAVRAVDQRRVEADRHLTVAVTGARMGSAVPTGRSGEASAAVILNLAVSVPVSIVAAELDGAPPVSRPEPGAVTTMTQTPSLTVRWRVLCAEVGSIPGPRLLDVDVRARSGDEHRRVTLATTDDDPVSRVFWLAAAQACATGGS